MASPAITQDRAVASSDSWTGWIVFGGFVLIIVGAIDALQGLVAIVKDDYVPHFAVDHRFVTSAFVGCILDSHRKTAAT